MTLLIVLVYDIQDVLVCQHPRYWHLGGKDGDASNAESDSIWPMKSIENKAQHSRDAQCGQSMLAILSTESRIRGLMACTVVGTHVYTDN